MNVDSFGPFLERYLDNTTRLEHPGYVSHQVGSPDFPSGLADLIHGRVNNIATVYELGPSATAVELVVVEWMLEKLGWSRAGGGVLTHGGAPGNLTGPVAPPAGAGPDSGRGGTPPDPAPPAAPAAAP